jgi:hypothetical protein
VHARGRLSQRAGVLDGAVLEEGAVDVEQQQEHYRLKSVSPGRR